MQIVRKIFPSQNLQTHDFYDGLTRVCAQRAVWCFWFHLKLCIPKSMRNIVVCRKLKFFCWCSFIYQSDGSVYVENDVIMYPYATSCNYMFFMFFNSAILWTILLSGRSSTSRRWSSCTCGLLTQELWRGISSPTSVRPPNLFTQLTPVSPLVCNTMFRSQPFVDQMPYFYYGSDFYDFIATRIRWPSVLRGTNSFQLSLTRGQWRRQAVCGPHYGCSNDYDCSVLFFIMIIFPIVLTLLRTFCHSWRVMWLVLFYASWSGESKNFVHVFADFALRFFVVTTNTWINSSQCVFSLLKIMTEISRESP